MIEIWEELNRFKGIHYNDEIKRIYDGYPETRCLGCGRCCYDSPQITYVEFLYAFDYYINQPHSKDDIISLYKKIFHRYMYGPIQELPCAFLDDDNRCIIHDASPYSCKRWGLQSPEEYQQDVESAGIGADEVDAYFGQHGIKVPDRKQTDYCNNVRIIKYNERNIDRLLDEAFQRILVLEQDFTNMPRVAYTIHNFFLAAFFKENRIGYDRIRQLKKYQAGDASAIDEFISSIDFDAKLESLFSNIEETKYKRNGIKI